jgi:hypothetical protein
VPTEDFHCFMMDIWEEIKSRPPSPPPRKLNLGNVSDNSSSTTTGPAPSELAPADVASKADRPRSAGETKAAIGGPPSLSRRSTIHTPPHPNQGETSENRERANPQSSGRLKGPSNVRPSQKPADVLKVRSKS